jgi:hypothetical protein
LDKIVGKIKIGEYKGLTYLAATSGMLPVSVKTDLTKEVCLVLEALADSERARRVVRKAARCISILGLKGVK